MTCSVVYCSQGHAMTMWTEPLAEDMHCGLCSARQLTSGYHCPLCLENFCDQSTSLEGRGDIRSTWEREMRDIVGFMKANKRLSGVAHFYHWRHANYIVSLGLLTEYVRELRTAKKTAENQIIQKPIIDKIKAMRAEIAKDVAYCASALRETAKPEHFIFKSKKKAQAEADRLQTILHRGYLAASQEQRALAGIACPLGHAMFPLPATLQPYAKIPPPDTPSTPTAPLSWSKGVSMKKRSVSMSPALMELALGLGEEDEEAIEAEALSRELQEIEDSFKAPVLRTPPRSSKQSAQSSSSTSLSSKIPVGFPTGRSAKNVPTGAGAGAGTGAHTQSEAFTLVTLEGDGDFGDLNMGTIDVGEVGEAGEGGNVDMGEVGEVGDVYSEEEELRHIKDKHPPRLCRVCALSLGGGCSCALCEYDLCGDCSVVYCRLGHALKIWTMAEAATLSCDMCKKSHIVSGYRCLVCEIDVCDMCTAQDARNAFMLWPKRELRTIMALLGEMRGDSEIAEEYLSEQEAAPPLNSMSLLCKKLHEAGAIKMHVDEEVRLRRLRLDAQVYGLKGIEL
ncbi:hypothetical protein B484DRAFT_449947 [Ochromonadaceae sp. CCMP2298]|nr:hypothetical protein B484DRAFT_449947 [Ochromonadaceae sp. CCMP2298]